MDPGGPGHDHCGIGCTQLVTDTLAALSAHGTRRFVIVNPAIDNISFLCEAARETTLSVPEARVMIVNWWDVVGEDFRNTLARDTGVARTEDHRAGTVESSLVMHIAPEATHPERSAQTEHRGNVGYTAAGRWRNAAG
ncbi:creatininase family protein [Nocardia carnea]|uniref:Creatininase family protein n=1 Tax=Nocardia carnea TaxID=37328 RepID=A0ABW7TW93_9NOCA|nr:creatininase family protein [Nocardia carnea]